MNLDIPKPTGAWEGVQTIIIKVQRLAIQRPSNDGSTWVAGSCRFFTPDQANNADFDDRYALPADFTGNITETSPQETYRASAEWVWDNRSDSRRFHRWKLKLQQMQPILMNTKQHVLQLLQSLEGMGPSFASRMWNAHGSQVFDQIRDLGVAAFLEAGVPEKTAKIAEADARPRLEEFSLREYLGIKAGFAPETVQKIILHLRAQNIDQMMEAIRNDPYGLQGIPGVPFKKLDALGVLCNVPYDDPRRVAGALKETLSNPDDGEHRYGHCYLAVHNALTKAMKILTNFPDLVSRWNEYKESPAVQAALLIDPYNNLWFRWMHQAECGIVSQIMSLMHAIPLVDPADISQAWDNVTQRWLRDHPMEADGRLPVMPISATQQSHVLDIPKHPIAVLKGPAGTGKTATLNWLVQLLHQFGKPMFLVSPTNKAARRLSEATGMDATSIHRLLGLRNADFVIAPELINEGKPCFVILDEAGMVTTALLYSLLNALPFGSHLILVGDDQQLAPVGPGLPFLDIINSGVVPVFALSEIFRSEGKLLEFAYAILEQRQADISEEDSDVIVIDEEDPERIAALVMELYEAMTPEERRQCRVIGPVYKDPAGITDMNRRLQALLNPPGLNQTQYLKKDGVEFRPGELIVWTENLLDRRLVNGQDAYYLGLEVDPTEGRSFLVRTYQPGQGDVEYWVKEEEWGAKLGYEVSCHAFQGSETPWVIIIVRPQDQVSISWLYTAATRPKRGVVFIGDRGKLTKAHNRDKDRRTQLRARLIKAYRQRQKEVA
jgi:exodeoxyribonuclease V alpha subunit